MTSQKYSCCVVGSQDSDSEREADSEADHGLVDSADWLPSSNCCQRLYFWKGYSLTGQ